MSHAADFLRSQHKYPLPMERMVGIADDKRLAVMMGSMLTTRGKDPNKR